MTNIAELQLHFSTKILDAFEEGDEAAWRNAPEAASLKGIFTALLRFAPLPRDTPPMLGKVEAILNRRRLPLISYLLRSTIEPLEFVGTVFAERDFVWAGLSNAKELDGLQQRVIRPGLSLEVSSRRDPNGVEFSRRLEVSEEGTLEDHRASSLGGDNEFVSSYLPCTQHGLNLVQTLTRQPMAEAVETFVADCLHPGTWQGIAFDAKRWVAWGGSAEELDSLQHRAEQTRIVAEGGLKIIES